MRPTDMTAALRALLPTKRPLFLWGPPGVGKSALVKTAASALGLALTDVRAVLLDPVDLRGLPAVHDGKATWCVPDFLPSAGAGVLFLDELAQAPPLVQSACLQLTLDRRIGEYELPPDWTIVAASNRAEDRAGAHRLISPLLNRFIHLDLDVNLEDWNAWAVDAGVSPIVRSFLQFRPALLHQFQAASGARSFPTPRSWEFVSQVLDSTPDSLTHPIVSGCVGEGPAAEFVAYLKVYRELPDMQAVLAAPTTHPVPKEPAVQYAVCGALTEHLRQNVKADATAAVQFAIRLPKEFTTLAMRDFMAVRGSVASVPAFKDWMRENRAMFLT